MRPAWWLTADGENVRVNAPVYSDETGWAKVVLPESFYGAARVGSGPAGEPVTYYEVYLEPLARGGDTYSRRMVNLLATAQPNIEYVETRNKNSRIRLPGTHEDLELMLEIIRLRARPLLTGPFNYGKKETRFKGAAYDVTTRQGRYKAARRTGNRIEFARALRDLFQRWLLAPKMRASTAAKLSSVKNEAQRIRGPSADERAVMTRMMEELALEMVFVRYPGRAATAGSFLAAKSELETRLGVAPQSLFPLMES